MSLWQQHTPDGYAVSPEPARKQLRGTRATAVGIRIDGQVDRPRAMAQLLKLMRVEMNAQ